jgi:peroxiredoxin
MFQATAPASESWQGVGRRRPMRAFSACLLACLLCLSLALPALPASALDSGQKLPEIGLTDLSGRKVDAASLQGKVVIVDFLASWCGPCKQELPVLQKLYKTYASQGLVVIGVSVDEDLDNLKGLLKQVKPQVTFPVVHDASKAVANRYKPSRMPSSYIIDRKGIVRHVQAGFRSEDAAKLEAQVKALLAK